ncbi:2559_t:CDS:2 [Entrophospora sp. SA101]|nr:2559_t:CDS:2 [Entrophospora sp. SA101]
MGAANTKCISENRVLSKNKATFRIKKQFSNSSNSSSSSYKKTSNCSECKQPTIENNLMIGGEWCNSCNAKRFRNEFSNWTSGNSTIDSLIKESQMNARDHNQVLEWIPYEKVSNIEYLSKGGFSNVYFGNWKDGKLLQWDCKKKQWIRSSDMVVTLKSLKSFVNIEDDFFSEKKLYGVLPYVAPEILREVCTTFRASDFINKNNNNGTEKNEGGKDKGEVLFHRRAYYISKPLDFKNLPEPTNYYNRTFINGVNNNNNLDNYNLRPNLKTGSDTSLHRQKSAETFKSNESFIHHNVNLEQLRTPSMIESGRTAIYTDLLKRKQKAADRFFFYIEPDNSAATIIECELSPKKFDDDKQDIINEKHYADYDDYNDNYEDYEDPLMDGRNKIYTTQQPFVHNNQIIYYKI